MDATPHLVVGAVLTMRARPALAFAMGVATNAVLDAIPHYNYTGWRPMSPALIVDLLVGICLAVVVASIAPKPWGALAGAAGGIFPEVERTVSGATKDFLARPPLGFPQFEIGPPWGIMTQVAVTLVALLIAVAVGRRRLSMQSRRHPE